MKPELPKYPELWTTIVGESGRTWLIPVDVPNKGDYIHCTAFADITMWGEGYGGSTLKFKLDNGEVFELHGGWHGNSNSLLADTGIDLTEMHYTHITTFVRYALPEISEGEIVYDNEGWCLGTFEREDDLRWIKDIADDLPYLKEMQITKYSIGGSSSFWITPKKSNPILN